jgi:hypothetical protein
MVVDSFRHNRCVTSPKSHNTMVIPREADCHSDMDNHRMHSCDWLNSENAHQREYERDLWRHRCVSIDILQNALIDTDKSISFAAIEVVFIGSANGTYAGS